MGFSRWDIFTMELFAMGCLRCDFLRLRAVVQGPIAGSTWRARWERSYQPPRTPPSLPSSPVHYGVGRHHAVVHVREGLSWPVNHALCSPARRTTTRWDLRKACSFCSVRRWYRPGRRRRLFEPYVYRTVVTRLLWNFYIKCCCSSNSSIVQQ